MSVKDNPFRNEDLIQQIKDAEVNEIVEVVGESTTGRFYKGLYSWLHRNNYPFEVRCKTVKDHRGQVLHVQKVSGK